jgi:hypothetical protein
MRPHQRRFCHYCLPIGRPFRLSARIPETDFAAIRFQICSKTTPISASVIMSLVTRLENSVPSPAQVSDKFISNFTYWTGMLAFVILITTTQIKTSEAPFRIGTALPMLRELCVRH